ncbi:hypothetical protein FGIG_00020 [Fasciola gigantica]|uniref:Uncharacterized protein n=1 Tax=Fasciola gigantica TaxID=46835 RepID=A0A504YLX8_FASGI|nr:hypothetical protein FGIG_00020 [Fasciola gigantica]
MCNKARNMQTGARDQTGLENSGSKASSLAALSGSTGLRESTGASLNLIQNVTDTTKDSTAQSSITQLAAAASFFTRQVMHSFES